MPPLCTTFITLPRYELRAIRRLPHVRQILQPASRHSRASCFSHPTPSQRTPRPTRTPECWKRIPGHVASFRISAAQHSQPESTNQQQPRNVPPADRQQQQDRPLTTSKLTATLKSKLPSFRHENIYTLPNILTFSRLIATPFIGYLIINNHHLYAFSLFAYAGISDLLDGWIARRWNLQTVVGSVVDPMADKALMTTLVSCLAINGSLPLPLATLILGRDVSLAIAAIYFRYASLPAPKTLARYWDFSLPSAEVHPTTISKLNTFLQLGLIGTTMCVSLLHDPSATQSAAGGLLMSIQGALGGPDGVDSMVKGMSAVVAGTTMYSGLSYVWTKSAVKILGDDEILKKKQGFRGRMIIAGTFGSVIALAAGLWWKEQQQKSEKEANEEKDGGK